MSEQPAIVQITHTGNAQFNMVLGLGDDGKVYQWDTMYAKWSLYQPRAYEIQQPPKTKEMK